MSVTQTIRDLSKLKPSAEEACRLLFQECYKAGIKNIFITETLRTKERQAYLYAQGRTRPGNKVTWTLNSNHFDGLAWDIAVGPPQDLYDVTTLNKVGAIAKKLGITWGGSWSTNIDRPHFEVKKTWLPPKGYELEGVVVVPSNSKGKVQLTVKDKEEEVDEMFDPNNPSLMSEAKTYIKTAVDKGIIDKTWYDKLLNGTLTVSQFITLDIKIRRVGGK